MFIAGQIAHPGINTKFAKELPTRIINLMKDTRVPWGPVGYVTYKRTYSRHLDDNDLSSPKEEYWQTLARCLNGILHIGGAFSLRELEVLAGYLIQLKCNFSGRGLWQLGTATVNRLGGDSLQACWHVRVNEAVHPFAFTFEELMLGGGVGFSIMPEDVYEIPAVKFNVNVTRVASYDCDFIVPDNREGWVELLKRILQSFFFTGKDISYNPDCLRARGQRIKSFGGTASGSEDLVTGLGLIVNILKTRVGLKLRPIDALDIQNILGMIVVAGNVRRSAQIAKGSGRDRDFLLAKYWGDGRVVPRWRQQSNNTVAESNLKELLPEFWYGYETDGLGQAKGEPYGLYNPYLAANYGRLADGIRPGYNAKVCGPNPCIPGDVWIHTSNGPQQVIDLLNQPFVALVDGKPYKSTGFWFSGNKEVFEIETIEGYKIQTTANHKLLRWSRDGKPCQRRLDQLIVGDKLCLNDHRNVMKWNGEGSYVQGRLFGSLLGGDAFTNETAKLQYCHFEMRDHAETLIESKPANDLGDSLYLDDLARKFGIQTSKELDHQIERKSYAFYQGFLRAWFDVSGSVQGTTAKGVTNRLSSSTLVNLEIAQRMLARMGIVSTIYKERRPAQYRELPNGQGGWVTYWCKAQHDLVISCASLDVFQEKIGYREPAKRVKFRALLNSRRVTHEAKFYARIKSIKSVGFKDVYDCSVPKMRLFDASNFKVANCGEIMLESDEACNLAELYLTNLLDGQEFHTAAVLMYKCQKTISSLPFLYDRTNAVVSRNQRLGLGITGVQAAHHLRKPEMFDSVYKHILTEDVEYSQLLGVPTSIAYTTVKPSGTAAKLPNGCPPGGNPGYSLYSQLRMTFASDSPMLPTLREKGYPMEPKINLDGSRDFNTTMVSFPVRYPDGTPTEGISAIEQLENVVMLQRWWSDNAVSATIQYKPEEYPVIRDWLASNYKDNLKSIAFCRHSGHGFVQPPNEPLTREMYLAFVASVKPIESGDFKDGSDMDDTTIDGVECIGDRCGIK